MWWQMIKNDYLVRTAITGVWKGTNKNKIHTELS